MTTIRLPRQLIIVTGSDENGWAAELVTEGQPGHRPLTPAKKCARAQAEAEVAKANAHNGLTLDQIDEVLKSAGLPVQPVLVRAAAALREQLATLRDRYENMTSQQDPTDLTTWYENWQRGGLGGIQGDIGAAFNPKVVAALADLLAAIQHDAGDCLEQAEAFARLYRDARTRDQD